MQVREEGARVVDESQTMTKTSLEGPDRAPVVATLGAS
jgi:hypothetical protein